MDKEAKLQILAAKRDPMGAMMAHVQSLKGDMGPQGLEGKPGRDGICGMDGKDGTAGKDGKDGVAGPRGPRGPQGDPGTNGKDGVQGPKGDPGKDAPTLDAIIKEVVNGKKLTVDHIHGVAELKEFLKRGGYRGGGGIQTITAGLNMSVDSTNALAPIVALSIPVQKTAPLNPTLNMLWIDNT